MSATGEKSKEREGEMQAKSPSPNYEEGYEKL